MSAETDKEWNDLTLELMKLNDRMSVILKRLGEIDKATIKVIERGPLTLQHKSPGIIDPNKSSQGEASKVKTIHFNT